MKTIARVAVAACLCASTQLAAATDFPQTIRAQALSLMVGFEKGLAEQVKRNELPADAAACMVRGLDAKGPAYIETFFRSYFTDDELETLENFYSSSSGQKLIEIDLIAQRKRRGDAKAKQEVPPKLVFEDNSRAVTLLGTSAGRKISAIKPAMDQDRPNFMVVLRDVVQTCKQQQQPADAVSPSQGGV